MTTTATKIGKEAAHLPRGLADGLSGNVSHLVGAVSDRLSDIDLSPPSLPRDLPSFELPSIDLPSLDLAERLKDLPGTSRLRDMKLPGRSRPSPTWPKIVVPLAVVGVVAAGVIVMRSRRAREDVYTPQPADTLISA